MICVAYPLHSNVARDVAKSPRWRVVGVRLVAPSEPKHWVAADAWAQPVVPAPAVQFAELETNQP